MQKAKGLEVLLMFFVLRTGRNNRREGNLNESEDVVLIHLSMPLHLSTDRAY